jgi:predicted unusual protein kinase regulating ubiquinone biosynthesis (AarF/ABC1/UbiB family)
MPTLIQTIGRLGEVIWVSIRYLLLPFLLPDRRRAARPRAFRLALEHLGSTFVKLGQALALRFDLLPAEYCQELLDIRSKVTPTPFPIVRQIVLEELGGCPEDIFQTFEREPFAVVSGGQLHKATDSNGTPLVVKIQNSLIRSQFTADLRLMRWVARPLDWVGTFGTRTVRAFVEEFSRSIFTELDLQAAARNAVRMSDLSREDDAELSATIRNEYSGRRILTWEFIDGISVLEILNAIQRGDHTYLKNLKNRQYDLRKIARRIYWSALNQIYRDGIFHTDLSPAGILVLPRNVIGYVDFAVIGRLPEKMQDSLRFFLQSLLQENFDLAIDELLLWMSPSTSTNLAAFRQDLTRIFEDYLDGFRSDVGSFPRQEATYFIVHMMSVIRQHRVAISTGLALYFRTTLTLDAIVFELSPGYDPLTDQNRFLSLAASADARGLLTPARALEAAASSYQQVKEVISDFQQLQYSGRAIEVSLRSLQARVLQYAVWAILIGTGAYLGFRDQTFLPLQNALGIGEYWIPTALLIATLVFIAMIFSQGRKLAVLERSNVIGRSLSRRSFGRVR